MTDLNEDQVNFATVYAITRYYGGPEEGGWWYNWYDPVDTIQVHTDEEFETACTLLMTTYSSEKYGSIYSVLGGQDIEVIREDWFGQHATTERPHYE